MRVLVCTASRHGATTGIGDAIALHLRRAGHEVVHLDPEVVDAIDAYDAVVLGSAVYVGHWLRSAVDFAERFGPELRARRIWLFSSGPLGDLTKPSPDPVDLPAVLAAMDARDHRVFAGRLDRARLGIGERVVVAAVRPPDGDQRPWPEITAWADGIATELAQSGRPSLSLAT
jgi:menaquinone-dependent protoporphyrinogen oxidase